MTEKLFHIEMEALSVLIEQWGKNYWCAGSESRKDVFFHCKNSYNIPHGSSAPIFNIYLLYMGLRKGWVWICNGNRGSTV
jgi:hypothetical protein